MAAGIDNPAAILPLIYQSGAADPVWTAIWPVQPPLLSLKPLVNTALVLSLRICSPGSDAAMDRRDGAAFSV